jgi:hypothetical protein
VTWAASECDALSCCALLTSKQWHTACLAVDQGHPPHANPLSIACYAVLPSSGRLYERGRQVPNQNAWAIRGAAVLCKKAR